MREIESNLTNFPFITHTHVAYIHIFSYPLAHTNYLNPTHNSSTKILIFQQSVPYQGHLNPFVDLALKLASKGFTITFTHLEFLHHKLCNTHHELQHEHEVDLFSGARESGYDIRYTTISDPLPLDFDRDLHFEEYYDIMLREFPAIVDEFVGNIIRSEPDMLHFLVADTVYDWAPVIAQKYNLVNVSLWTQPALVFTLAYHWALLKQNGHYPCKDDVEEEIKYLPGVDSINTKDLMHYLKEAFSGSAADRGAISSFEKVKKADFIVHNTAQEIEPQTLSALNKYQPNYAIGPLNFTKNLPIQTVTRNLWSQTDCSSWLQSKPPGSVLYVSFGSFVHTDKRVIEEIAHGLVLSGVNFLWVIRQGILSDGDTDVLSKELLDEIKDRGLVVGWCDQIKILSDPAVGGFLTHCGWNSTLESMWCGVPMICYPIAFDQTCNRKLVVDDWKIGVNLCDGNSLDRKEVADKIKSFMNGGDSERLKESVGRMKEIVQKALQIDGSSETNFERFVKDLKAKIQTKKV